jgi:endonuclease/exonuclease/phosphatase (EEP) superfamily protein YafD
MMQIAEEVREMENGVFLVTGDLNDVAWSKVTTLFQKKSGLLDPRKGRGLYSTFHAKLPQFLRFPVDHLFHSKQIGFKSLNTVRLPGSDHLGICYEFTLSETERSLKEDVTSEREEEEIEEFKTPDNHE